MRARHFRAGPAWAVNLYEAPAQEPQAPEPELPRGQMIVLLEMRVPKAGPDSLYAKVLTYLRAVGSDEPDGVDYTRLRDAGYIRFNGIIRRDEMLPLGRHITERFAREIARRCGIHHIMFREALPRSNMGPSASCSCAQWTQIASRKRGDDDRVMRAAALHLDQVAKGAFKPRRPIEEFLNEHMPLQLPFNASQGQRTADQGKPPNAS